MASSMFWSNKKGKCLVYSKNELLFEFDKILNQMSKSCQCCEKKTCCYCSSYFFTLKEIEKQSLDIEFPNVWRIYLDINEYNFEVENCLVMDNFQKGKGLM